MPDSTALQLSRQVLLEVFPGCFLCVDNRISTQTTSSEQVVNIDLSDQKYYFYIKKSSCSLFISAGTAATDSNSLNS